MPEKIIFRTKEITESKTNTEGDIEGVGALRWVGPNLYRWVKNYHTVALTAGEVCFHKDGDGANFFERIYDAVGSDLSFMAGVVASTTIAADTDGSTGDGGYGWIQIFGYYGSVSMYASGGTAIVAGDSLIGEAAKTHVLHGTTTGTAPLHVRRILALEGLASSVTIATAKKGIIECV